MIHINDPSDMTTTNPWIEYVRKHRRKGQGQTLKSLSKQYRIENPNCCKQRPKQARKGRRSRSPTFARRAPDPASAPRPPAPPPPTGTVVRMQNGEKKVVNNIRQFEEALPPEYGTVLMRNGERWVVNKAKFEEASRVPIVV